MTAERAGWLHWNFHCDKCSEYFSTKELDDEIESFNDAWSAAQSAGWVSFQTGKKTAAGTPDYGHFCPSCAED